MKCVNCHKKADYVIQGYSLCENDIERFFRKMRQQERKILEKYTNDN